MMRRIPSRTPTLQTPYTLAERSHRLLPALREVSGAKPAKECHSRESGNPERILLIFAKLRNTNGPKNSPIPSL